MNSKERRKLFDAIAQKYYGIKTLYSRSAGKLIMTIAETNLDAALERAYDAGYQEGLASKND